MNILYRRTSSQHTSVPQFSVKSLKVEMLERGIMCLVRWALPLVFPVTVMCCHWLPRLFSRKSSLGAESWSCCNTSQSACDELCGQVSAGMSWAVLVLAVWRYQCPCGILQPHDDSEADMKSCGHSYSVQVSVWVDWHTPLKDDRGRNINCPLALLHQVCLGGGHPV